MEIDELAPDFKYKDNLCPKCGEELEVCVAWVCSHGHRMSGCNGWIHKKRKSFLHVERCKG